GGNGRKVSAALAFMANPELVFLDEPTTGLDAVAKRKLWEVIRAARNAGMTIILTSHSMEECEALCNRLGIMKQGQFLCIGKLNDLRAKFGTGYAVQIKVAEENIENMKNSLKYDIPGILFEEQHNGILFCTIPFNAVEQGTNNDLKLANIFKLFYEKKRSNEIDSYSVTQTTLEQIFVRLAGNDDDEDKKDEEKEESNSGNDPV
ncbi:unnamed protein product, partial [Didymodactylos carnosus]